MSTGNIMPGAIVISHNISLETAKDNIFILFQVSNELNFLCSFDASTDYQSKKTLHFAAVVKLQSAAFAFSF
jgi:hypothetical protein